MLRYCNDCKENSMKVKVYERKDGSKGRVMFCLNTGCGNKVRVDDTVQRLSKSVS